MSLDFWRNVAVIWLCFQGFFLLIIPLALSYLLVRAMGWVLRKTNTLFHTVQGYSRTVRNKTEAIADKVTQPVIQSHGKASGAAAVVSTLFHEKSAVLPDVRTLDRSTTTRKDAAWRVNHRAQG